jgi:hypothetical protein
MLVGGIRKSLQLDVSSFAVLSRNEKYFNFIKSPLFFGVHKFMANKAKNLHQSQ